jgi:hypothetical protein
MVSSSPVPRHKLATTITIMTTMSRTHGRHGSRIAIRTFPQPVFSDVLMMMTAKEPMAAIVVPAEATTTTTPVVVVKSEKEEDEDDASLMAVDEEMPLPVLTPGDVFPVMPGSCITTNDYVSLVRVALKGLCSRVYERISVYDEIMLLLHLASQLSTILPRIRFVSIKLQRVMADVSRRNATLKPDNDPHRVKPLAPWWVQHMSALVDSAVAPIMSTTGVFDARNNQRLALVVRDILGTAVVVMDSARFKTIGRHVTALARSLTECRWIELPERTSRALASVVRAGNALWVEMGREDGRDRTGVWARLADEAMKTLQHVNMTEWLNGVEKVVDVADTSSSSVSVAAATKTYADAASSSTDTTTTTTYRPSNETMMHCLAYISKPETAVEYSSATRDRMRRLRDGIVMFERYFFARPVADRQREIRDLIELARRLVVSMETDASRSSVPDHGFITNFLVSEAARTLQHGADNRA